MIGEDGYVVLIDFGISKKLEPKMRTYTLTGTPEYFAPELFKETGHDYMVDWWALGVLAYEIIIGRPPFGTSDDDDPRFQKLQKKICETELTFPDLKALGISVSAECVDFLSKCTIRNPAERLGSKNGVKDITEHPWFKGIDIDKLLKKEITMPDDLKPQLSDDALDLRYFSNEFADLPKRHSHMDAQSKLFIQENANLFKGFDI